MELSMALVQMRGLKCRIDDILSVTTYDEHADLRGLHASNETPYWVQTKVEHDGEDYYLMGYEDIPMEGMEVRVR